MILLRQLWRDQGGAVVASEILVIATILVIGLMVAWVAVRDAVIVQIDKQADWISGSEGEELESLGAEALGGEDIITCADVFGSGEG
jgi:hypothetical protein